MNVHEEDINNAQSNCENSLAEFSKYFKDRLSRPLIPLPQNAPFLSNSVSILKPLPTLHSHTMAPNLHSNILKPFLKETGMQTETIITRSYGVQTFPISPAQVNNFLIK